MVVLAIEIGRTSVKAGIVEDGALLWRIRIPHANAEGDLDRVADALNSWLPSFPALSAVGITVPGLLAPDGRRMTAAHNRIPGMVGFDLVEWSVGAFGIPAVIENDARAACWGEFLFGEGRGADPLALIDIGTGVGTAMIADGRLAHGAHGGGVLAGHQKIRANDPRCSCGGVGCVEAVASGWALHRDLASMHDRPTWAGPDATFGDVAAAARFDERAEAIRTRYLDAWSLAIANVVHVLDPARIVLSGGLMLDAHRFLPELRELVRGLLWDPGAMPELRVASDVWNSSTLGIAAIAQGALSETGCSPSSP